MNYQRMIELKRSLLKAVIAETLDIETIQRDHAEFRQLMEEYEANCAENEKNRQIENDRKQIIRATRKAEAEMMRKTDLANVCGLQSSRWTKAELVDHYVGLAVM